MNIQRVAAKCSRCGATLTPEEIEIGLSLVCSRCDPKLRKAKKPAEKQRTASSAEVGR